MICSHIDSLLAFCNEESLMQHVSDVTTEFIPDPLKWGCSPVPGNPGFGLRGVWQSQASIGLCQKLRRQCHSDNSCGHASYGQEKAGYRHNVRENNSSAPVRSACPVPTQET